MQKNQFTTFVGRVDGRKWLTYRRKFFLPIIFEFAWHLYPPKLAIWHLYASWDVQGALCISRQTCHYWNFETMQASGGRKSLPYRLSLRFRFRLYKKSKMYTAQNKGMMLSINEALKLLGI